MLMSDRQLAGSVSAEPPWPPPWRVSRGWLPDVYFLKVHWWKLGLRTKT